MTKPVIKKDLAVIIQNQLRGYIAASGLSATDLTKLITEKCGRPESPQSFSQKLARGTIKYAEVLEIANLLKYDINWVKRPE